MSEFKSELSVTQVSTRGWKLNKRLMYWSGPVTGFVVVPTNFITDFASVPRFLWPLIPPTGRYTRAAVLHDYLYSKGCKYDFERWMCDELLFQACQALGAKKWRCYAIYWGVRLGGWMKFKKK